MHDNVWKIGFYEQFKADGVCSGICKVCQDAGAKKHEYKISNESVMSLIVHTKQHSEYKAKLAKLEDNSKEAAVIQGFVVRSSGGTSRQETGGVLSDWCTCLRLFYSKALIRYNAKGWLPKHTDSTCRRFITYFWTLDWSKSINRKAVLLARYSRKI